MKISLMPVVVAALIVGAGLSGCSGETPESLLASAKQYLAQDNPKAAIVQLKNVLQKDPKSAEARFLLGKALLENGDPVLAAVELHKAEELKFDPDSVVPAEAKALLQQGQVKKVTDEFGRTSLTSPAAVADLKTSLASAYMVQGQQEQAATALQEAFRAVPDFVPALVFSARLKAAERDVPGAFKLQEQAATKAPKDIEVLMLKGDLLAYSKAEPTAVVEAYRQALAVRRDNVLAHSAIISTYLSGKDLKAAHEQLEQFRKERPGHPQVRYFEAQIALQERDYKTATEAVQDLLKVGGDNPRILQLAGTLAFETGSLLQAEQYLSKALQAAPGMVLARQMLTQTYTRQGQAAKALATIAPLLAAGKPSAETLSLAGAAHLRNGDTKEAEALFARAIALDPNDARSRTALALTRLRGDKSEAAFEDLESIAGSDPGISADLALINANLQRKDLNGTLKAIDGLEKKQPNKPLAFNLRGKVLLLNGDAEGARKNFERALALDPLYFPAAEALAALDLRDGKPDAAEQRFQALLKVQPSNSAALLAIAQLRERAGRNKEEVAELMSKAAKANPSELAPRLLLIDFHLRHKDSKLALDAAQDAASTFPDTPVVVEALARSQLAAGDVNQAITSYTKLTNLRPESAQPHIGLADAYLVAGKRDEALRSLKSALAISPQFLPAQEKAIAVEAAAGRTSEALALARSVQKQRPSEAVGFGLEGDIEASGKNWDRAVAAYRRAIRQQPTTAHAEKLHAVLKASKKGPEASTFASQWLKDHPQDSAFLFYIGTSALVDKDYAAAESSYAQVLKQHPEHAGALNNMAWTMAKLNRPGALALAEKANKLQPDQPTFMDTLAMILAEEGKLERAIEIEKKAIALEPKNNGFRLAIAKLYLKAGDKPSARRELEQLSQMGDKFPDQREVQQLRAQL